jgi:hypothetical protein
MLVEAAQREVSVVEIHTHHRPFGPSIVARVLCAENVGSRWRAGPGRGEVTTAPAGLTGDLPATIHPKGLQ